MFVWMYVSLEISANDQRNYYVTWVLHSPIMTMHYGIILASFPGSPRARTKNRKERGEPGKIYHVRNVIGRENLITVLALIKAPL